MHVLCVCGVCCILLPVFWARICVGDFVGAGYGLAVAEWFGRSVVQMHIPHRWLVGMLHVRCGWLLYPFHVQVHYGYMFQRDEVHVGIEL